MLSLIPSSITYILSEGVRSSTRGKFAVLCVSFKEPLPSPVGGDAGGFPPGDRPTRPCAWY